MHPLYGAPGAADSRRNGAIACRFNWQSRVGVSTDKPDSSVVRVASPACAAPAAMACATATEISARVAVLFPFLMIANQQVSARLTRGERLLQQTPGNRPYGRAPWWKTCKN